MMNRLFERNKEYGPSDNGPVALPGPRRSKLFLFAALSFAGFSSPAQSTEARITLRTHKAKAAVFLNDRPVPLSGGAAELELKQGVNILAIEARATGKRPWLNPVVEAQQHHLQINWGTLSDTPGKGWRRTILKKEWPTARRAGRGIWSGAGAKQAFLAATLYVGKNTPQFFPRMDTFYLPRGSRQLLKVYLHTPAGVPSEDYRLIVEAPSALKLIAADMPEEEMEKVLQCGSKIDAGGIPMTRHEIAYGLFPGSGMELSLRWGDRFGNNLAYQPAITAGGTFGWRHLSVRVKPPARATNVHPLIIKWQNRGIAGTFWVDNVVFREAGTRRNLLKMGTFDEPGWGKNGNITREGLGGSKCVKIVAPPEYANRQQAIWVDKAAGGGGGVLPVNPSKSYVVELDVRCEKLGSKGSAPVCGLLFEAPREMKEAELPIYTYFETLGGRVCELPVRSRLEILPPLKNVRPRHARICPCYYGSKFHHPEVARAYAENCWASGITWTYGRVSNDVVPLLLGRGLKVILSIGYNPWSAPAGAKHLLNDRPGIHAVDFKGKRRPHEFCPTWMLSEGGEVMKALEEWLLDTVNNSPYAAANWDLEQPVVDPPTFCTCNRCLKAFRMFANLQSTTPLEPALLLKNYRKEWTDFRCAQNAELAGRLKSILEKAQRPMEFSLYTGYQCRHTREHYGADWSRMAPHLDFAIAGYGGNRQQIYGTRAALGKLPFMSGEMWYLSPNSDARPRPRMETWRNRILRQYVESGCHGCLIWYLPTMDGGAFYATSEAAALIARYEDFFKADQRCDSSIKVTGIEPGNWAAFEKDGKTLVLLMNFNPEPAKAIFQIDGREFVETLEPYGTAVCP